MAVLDAELSALVNTAHQSGSSTRILSEATTIRLLFSTLRQHCREIAEELTENLSDLPPPLSTYRPYQRGFQRTSRLDTILSQLGGASESLAAVSRSIVVRLLSF